MPSPPTPALVARARATTWLLPAAVGVCGAVVVAIAAQRVGSQHDVHLDGRVSHDPAWTEYFVGAILLCLAFLFVGRLVLGAGSRYITARQVQVCGLVWAVPIALAEPIGSHDLWAYAAQGNLYLHGVDPYRYGPAQLPGAYNLQVSPIWRHTPAPYGPLFLAMARVAVSAAGPHVDTAVRLLKLLAFASFVITVLLLPALCRAFRVDDTTAMWLFAANPLILLVGVGGGHNDLIITGLLAVGLWLVTRPGGLLTTLVPAALVVALAAEVKIPAAIALVFLPHIWRLTRRRGGVPPPLLPSCVAVAVCGVVVAAATVIGTGLGFGWVHRLSAADTGITWLSVPITLVLADEWAHARVHVPLATSHLTYAGALAAQLSSVLAVVLLVPLWWLARRRDPTLLLGVALALAVVLSTSVWPWYLSWVLLVGVLAGLRRGVLVGIAGISLGLMLGVGPDGVTSFNVDQGIGLIMLAALVTWALLVLPVPRTTVPSWRSI